jgi:hypothetical protein
MGVIAGGIDKHTPADGTFIVQTNPISKMAGMNPFDIRAGPGAICDRMAIGLEGLVEPTLPKVCEPFARTTIHAQTWNLDPGAIPDQSRHIASRIECFERHGLGSALGSRARQLRDSADSGI